MQPKFVAAQKIVKQKPSKHQVGLLGFITLGILYSAEARVYCLQLHELPIDMGNSSALPY